MAQRSAPRVGIVMGSDSDLAVMEHAGAVLDELGVPYMMTVASAHRAPDLLRAWVRKAESDGIRVIIAGAGGVPVATMAIGKAGAKNAGVLAARILALQDEGVAKRLVEYRAGMANDVENKAKIIEERHTSTRRSDSESSR